MRIAQLPSDEAMRLADLASYNILDTAAEKEFDELVELAGQICNCPISLLSLVDKNRIWLKARNGVSVAEIPRDIGFCSHAILQDDIFTIGDALHHDDFADNPLVTGETHIRFYAGIPITSPAGYKLGTVCVLDTVPHELNVKQQRAMEIISGQVNKLLELRVKNRTITQNASELIAIKSKVIEETLHEQEASNLKVAKTLHEDFAQRLAASIFFIDIATSGKVDEKEYMDKARSEIRTVIQQMRSMSYLITPTTVEAIPADVLFNNFFNANSSILPFSIHFTSTGKKMNFSEEQNIALFRVVQQWTDFLKNEKDVHHVGVNLHTGKSIELNIQDDAESKEVNDLKFEVMTRKIDSYIERLGGSVDCIPGMETGNRLTAVLPL